LVVNCFCSACRNAHFLLDIVTHFISPEIHHGQMHQHMIAKAKAENKGHKHYPFMGSSCEQRRNVFSFEEQEQDENKQDDILIKGLPGGKRNGIPETTTIRHLVEISGIEGEEGEENDHQQQCPGGELWEVPDEQHDAQHEFDNDEGYCQDQRKGSEELQIEHTGAEILFELKRKSYGII